MFCLIVWLAGSAGVSADVPPTVEIEAELDADAALGASLQILSGDYPPQKPDGWFSFEAGNETGTFLLNETTGAVLLNRPDQLARGERSPLILTIEHGRREETEGQTTKRTFLQAAGLSDRDISRRLGLVTRYVITVRIKSLAPEFPSRPLHFYWPAEGRTVSEVRAASREKIHYQLLSQHPENWIVLNPETGTLQLTGQARSSHANWQGVVEACDDSGRKATTIVWITEPLALPSLSMPPLKSFWPEEAVDRIRGRASAGIQSVFAKAGTWKFDPAELAKPPESEATISQPEETLTAASETEIPAESQALPEELTEPVSRTAWYVALFGMVAASLLYMIARHTRSTAEGARKEKKNPNPVAQRESRERTFAKQEPNPVPQQDEEFEWEAVLKSVGDNSEDWPSPPESAMTTLEMDAPKQNRPLLPAELFAPTGDSRQEQPAALVKGNLDPTADLEQLLSQLDTEFSEGQETEESAPSRPGTELAASDSISDYMNNLLAKYTKPSGKTSQPAPAMPAPVAEPAPAPPKPASPARTSTGIPEPVYHYDREVTRSQLELLRETSNLNAAHAIRLATSRRRRRILLRWSALIVVALVIYVVRQYFVG